MGAIWGTFVGFLEWVLLEFSILTGSAGIGLILFTIVARVTIMPLTLTSVRSSRRMQELQPQIRELQRKYGKDQAKLSEETIKLYKEFKVNPAASCLPLFLQLPIFFGVYQAVYHLMIPENHKFLSAGVQSLIADPNVAALLLRPFLGLDLGKAAYHGGFAPPYYFILPILSVVLQLVQQIMAMPRVQDPQQKAMSQAMLVMPLVFAYISFTFPMGAVFYWVVGSIIGITQQYFISGWGSLVNYLPFLPERTPATATATAAVPAVAPDSNVVSSSGSTDAATPPAKMSFWDVLRPLTEEQPAAEAAGAAGATSTIVEEPTERPNERGRQQARADAQRKLRRRR